MEEQLINIRMYLNESSENSHFLGNNYIVHISANNI